MDTSETVRDGMRVSAETDPDLILVGDRIALGPLRQDLAAMYARWINDAEVRAGLEYLSIATPESEQTWIEETVKAGAEREPNVAAFTIYELAELRPVGTVSLFSVSYLHRTAKLGILLGEGRGQGFGTEATRLALRWAFDTLGLNNVMLEALAWNTAALRAYEKAGFQRIGTRRKGATSRGVASDVILMDAVRDDFDRSGP